MPKWLSFSAILSSLLLAAVPTHALDIECDTQGAGSAASMCVVMSQSGARGVWFELGVANELRRKSRLLDGLQLQLNKYSMLASLAEKEVTACRQQVHILESSRTNLQRQADIANADARSARAELAAGHRWYTSPVFWGIAMFIAGAAIQHACCGPGK